LGETRDQCRQRYGNPAEEQTEGGATVAIYKLNGFKIQIMFINGVAELIDYEKKGEWKNAALTADEIKTFLSANTQGSSWTKLDRMKEAFGAEDLERRDLMRDAMKFETWERGDGKATAHYKNIDDTLMIYTEKARVFIQKDKENPLKGF
jgi:hypothetical protein